MSLHILRDLQFADLQRRVNKVSMENLLAYLTRTGSVCTAMLNCGRYVMKWISYGNKVIRAYGNTLRDCLISLNYQAWVV